MKIGVAIGADPRVGIDALCDRATALERSGLDLVWFEQGPEEPAPFCSAAAIAAATRFVRLGVCVEAGDHPLAIAADATVLDACSNGRLVLAIRSADAGLLRETVAALDAALTGLPFGHQGERWRIPAGLPENGSPERRLTLTPGPTQPQLPLLLAGPAAAAVAATLGKRTVSPLEPDEGDRWPDPEALVGRLLERREEGEALAVVRPPAGTEFARLEQAASTIVRLVRPRVQLDRLPPGLDEYWRRSL